MLIRDLLLPEFDQEMASTRKMLERIPADKLTFQPHEKCWKINQISGHIVDMIGWTPHIMNTELLVLTPKDLEHFVPGTPQEMLERFAANVLQARHALETASDADMQKIWTMEWDGKQIMQMPRYNVLRSILLNHLIHHRAQLSMYLRLAGVAIPGMYGPSADEPQMAGAEKSAA